jgi:pterin-4a-carbinolamine dehydratase
MTRICGALTAYRRYLRARRFVPQEAFKQFKDTEDWRKDNKLDQIFETIDVEEFEQTRRLVCQVVARPVWVLTAS